MPLIMYGVSRSDRNFPGAMSGLSGAPVRLLDLGQGLSAAVSELRESCLLPRRKNLAEFQHVIQMLSLDGDVLPMSFGMVSEDEDEIVQTLGTQTDSLLESLDRIAGKAEFSLRVMWQGENVFAHFVESRDELRKLRDTYFAGSRAPTHQNKMHLGQTFERLLQETRDDMSDRLINGLGSAIEDHSKMPLGTENCFASLALLVRRDAIAQLDAAVDSLAPQLPDDIVLEVNGPWPPYSFVNLRT